MTVYEVALGVGLALALTYWAVDHLFKICRIEELEAEINGCKKEVKNAKKNR